ncbi:hypothetical protein BJ912DRAFT_566125 [Pholiota molesta]|nr:hypothetical protein BJ912DRAFT_566125 [Pholiota molesta]
MKNIFSACVLAFLLLLASAAPLNTPKSSCAAADNYLAETDSDSALTSPAELLAYRCSCRGRRYQDIGAVKYSPAHFSNFEGIRFSRCPGNAGLTRWKLSNLDRAVYRGSRFCGCITHQGARRNGFKAC